MDSPRTPDSTDAARTLRTSQAGERSGSGQPRAIRRTRTGCRTCRLRKIKCSEQKPSCEQCLKAERVCQWIAPEDEYRRARAARRPNATACDYCKQKKLKCVGESRDACNKCNALRIPCLRSQQPYNTSPLPPESPSITSHGDGGAPDTSTPSKHLPRGQQLEDLVQLYFSSVHKFGFMAFLHPLQFNRLRAEGKAPKELTLLMCASAVRFASAPTKENLQQADAWVDAALEVVLPQIYQGFGVTQLMTLLLAQAYDLARGNFSSAWLLGANCTRMMQMMSLQTFDRTFSNMPASDSAVRGLLSGETLRRLAWSTFYMDAVIDGGRYGFHTVDEKAFRLQLPCDEDRFLGNEKTVTEPLYPKEAEPAAEKATLGISAYLIRTGAARRRALFFAFRASHHEDPPEKLATELSALETDMENVANDLPARFHLTPDNLTLQRDRLSTFILLHILRHNLFIIVGRAALQIFVPDMAKASLVEQARRKRISHALPISSLVEEGLKAGVVFDPQIGVQAYVALEILLFEPRRLAETDFSVDPTASRFTDAMLPLLTVIRNLAARAEFVKNLHAEAIYRVLGCDLGHFLLHSDMAVFRSEFPQLGTDAAEYDFRDFRWAKIERMRRGLRSSANAARDETLLEFDTGEESAPSPAAPDPKLDAMDVSSVHGRVMQHELGTGEPEGTDEMEDVFEWAGPGGHAGDGQPMLPLDWPWLLGT